MKLMISIVAAGLLFAPAAALAQGASEESPGHEMKEPGAYNKGPGASQLSPGHQMKKGDETTGASTYAPGHKKGDMDSDDRSKTMSKDPDRDKDIDKKPYR